MIVVVAVAARSGVQERLAPKSRSFAAEQTKAANDEPQVEIWILTGPYVGRQGRFVGETGWQRLEWRERDGRWYKDEVRP